MKFWPVILWSILLPFQEGWAAAGSSCACNTDECWKVAREQNEPEADPKVKELEQELAETEKKLAEERKTLKSDWELYKMQTDEDRALQMEQIIRPREAEIKSLEQKVVQLKQEIAVAKNNAEKFFEDWRRGQEGMGLQMGKDSSGQWLIQSRTYPPKSTSEVCDDPALGDNKNAYEELYKEEERKKEEEKKKKDEEKKKEEERKKEEDKKGDEDKEESSSTPDAPNNETPADGDNRQGQAGEDEEEKPQAPGRTGAGKYTGKRFNDIPGKGDYKKGSVPTDGNLLAFSRKAFDGEDTQAVSPSSNMDERVAAIDRRVEGKVKDVKQQTPGGNTLRRKGEKKIEDKKESKDKDKSEIKKLIERVENTVVCLEKASNEENATVMIQEAGACLMAF